MEIEFKGDDLSLWMKNPHMATGKIQEMGVFFATKFFVHKGMTYSDGSPIPMAQDTVALGIYETDQKIIALNVQEKHFKLAYAVRLIDTRYGLVMYIKWNLSPGTPQSTFAEHFLNMHSPDVIQILRNMCDNDFFIIGYCDFHSRKVVRPCIMPPDNFLTIGLVAEQAAQIIDEGETYAGDLEPQKAFQEVMDYVDKNPLSSVMTVVPEKTY